MNFRFDSKNKAKAFFAVIVASLVAAVIASGQNNEFWSSPLIALAIMFFFGSFPSEGKDNQFEWFYLMLVIGSLAILLFTPQKVYWTTPMLLGVLHNLFVPGGIKIDFGGLEPKLEEPVEPKEKKKNDQDID